MIDYELAKFALALANVVGTLAVAAYTFVATRDKDNSQHIKAVEVALTKAIGESVSRLDRIEMQMRYMPTPDQISALQGDMQGMKAMQEALKNEIHLTRQAASRIEDFLLSNK